MLPQKLQKPQLLGTNVLRQTNIVARRGRSGRFSVFVPHSQPDNAANAIQSAPSSSDSSSLGSDAVKSEPATEMDLNERSDVESGQAAELPEKRRSRSWNVRQLKSQLQGYGSAGLLSYGLLNTVYYSGAFLVFWHLAKVPRGQGWSAVYKQFGIIMGATWAASQLTKVFRAGLALALAPTVQGILIYLQARLRLRTRRNASIAFVGICLLLASLVFGSTLLWWA